MAKLDLVIIPAKHIDDVWFMIEPLVSEGIIEDNERYTVDAIKNIAMKDIWQTWVAWDIEKKIVKVVMFSELYTELSGLRIASIRFLYGRERKEWMNLLPILEARMASADVQLIEIWARRGWLRELPEYKMTHVLLEKDLTNGQISEDRRINPRYNGSTRLNAKSKPDKTVERSADSKSGSADDRTDRSDNKSTSPVT